MKTPTTSRSAIVADDRALMRDLLRVALDELGIVTASEVSTGAAAIDAAAEHRPDVLILHEGAGLGGSEVIERIRCASPASTVVVLTSDRRETPPALAAAADAVVEEGGGLQDLPSVLGTGGSGPPRRPTRRDRRTPDARGERWVKRLQGALAASILLLSILVILPSTGFDGGLAAAQESLGSLVEELPDATPEEAVSLATTLISHRAMLLSSHVDVTALDAEIAERIHPMLETLPGDVAAGVSAVLGDLLTTEGSEPPTPAASTPGAATTAPDPTEAPANDPVSTAPPTGDPVSPTPSGPPSSTPSDSPSPSPGESPTPSPSESPTPGPGDLVQPTPADPSGRPAWAGSGSDSAPNGGEPRGVGLGSGGRSSGPRASR